MTPTLTKLGQLATEQGDTRRAGALLGESLKLAREQGDRLALANCLEALARLATATGQPEGALRIGAAAAELREAIGAPPSPNEQAKLDVSLVASRERRDAVAADTAWREGRSLPIDALILSAVAMLDQVSEGEGGGGPP
jgi:ATP/maltotriose-dependent transcriptional regulator MalT